MKFVLEEATGKIKSEQLTAKYLWIERDVQG
jgi:hypothetical protein